MPLVDYGDSESESESEQKPVPLPPKTITSDKPAFKKVVDRANSHKIRVNLPDTFRGNIQGAENNGDEPPTKRAKTASGAFGGFNALLPAPKKSAAPTLGSGARNTGYGSGVSLKTGSAPGFSRDPMSNLELSPNGNKSVASESVGTLETSKVDEYGMPMTALEVEKPMPPPKVEVRTQGNPMMFRPLSVAHKLKKKKPTQSSTADISTTTTNSDIAAKMVTAPKVSLFSVEAATETTLAPSTSNDYQPLIYSIPGTNSINNNNDIAESESPSTNTDSLVQPSPPDPPYQTSPSLSTIATDLNLDPSARRQLLGRRSTTTAPINIVNFNTDAEYAANELLRQAGEQVQHNPVRAIAPGKHSLKQLVNAASTQKDALEEQFASGKRNKKEAGSKYGW